MTVEEKPRKAWYKLGCRECEQPTTHAALTDGLCPACLEKADRQAPFRMQMTGDMLNAGIDVLRSQPQLDARMAAEVFEAMVTAMPLEQKRVLLRNPVFGAPKPVLVSPQP